MAERTNPGGTAAVTAVAEQARRAAQACLDELGDDELCESVLAMARLRAAVDAWEGHLLSALARREVCEREFGLSTTGWVADRTRVPRAVAHQRVMTARKLHDHLEVVDVALGEGRISFDHAKLLAAKATRIMDGLVELAPSLVEAAEHAPFAIWQAELVGVVELLDQDGGHDPTTDLARNHLHLNRVGADTTVVSGELFGEYALAVTQAIEAEADRLFRQLARDDQLTPDLPLPARSTLRAMAWADLCRRALGADGDHVTAPAADVTLVVHADDPGEVTTGDGLALDYKSIAHLVCDPIFHRVLVHPSAHHRPGRSGTGDAGAESRCRSVSDGAGAHRRQDPCSAAPASKPHHIVPWEQGGPTDMHNLALLCRHHHGVTHRTGWTMTAKADGSFTWKTPSGRVLRSHPRPERLPAA